jgi:hypothetical protein
LMLKEWVARLMGRGAKRTPEMAEQVTALNLKSSSSSVAGLPAKLAWLADAPLYIDSDQVGRFYDAVVRPQVERGELKLTLTEERIRELKAKLGLEASVEAGGLLGEVLSLFAKPSVKATAEGEAGQQTKDGKSTEITLKEIDTPQRQLEQLVLHYLLNRTGRIFLPTNPAEAPWRDQTVISQVPRGIVFLDLPGRAEADITSHPRTKLIPTAIEFADGTIDPVFRKLKGPKGEEPPPFPEGAVPTTTAINEYHKYWQWFDENFSATRAMILVEEAAAAAKTRIRWIDYRVPLTNEGHTLHLHVSPAGNYDTGVFAYNFIKRGYNHGLRIVGTLKSGPDVNVLAIYEK